MHVVRLMQSQSSPGNNLEARLENKNGTAPQYLQISDSISSSRALKQKMKKKKRGETRQCQTGMVSVSVWTEINLSMSDVSCLF